MSLFYKFNPLGITYGVVSPIPETRGIFVYSGSVIVSSSMSVSGIVLGDGQEATRMNIYSSGVANNITFTDNGLAVVLNGGTMSNSVVGNLATVSVSSGGSANGITVLTGGAISIIDGNITSSVVSAGGFMFVWGEATVDSSTLYGIMRVSSAAVVSDTDVMLGGSMFVSSGGSANATVVSSGGYMKIFAGGIATNITSETGATVIDEN